MYESDGITYERKASRETILAKTEIRIDGHWHNCRIINISTGGAKLRFDQHTDIGLTEFLKIGTHGHFKTTVVWRHRDEIGVDFACDDSQMAEVIKGLWKITNLAV